jgi:hypothetical protein
MKKSDELRDQANREDNDLKAMGLYNKSLREGRLERFEDTHLTQLLRAGYDVAHIEEQGKYTIDTDIQETKYGLVDYYPKANKILIRKQNKWIKPGLKWIIKNLL